jgi:UDP-MurNAc hydroxylase
MKKNIEIQYIYSACVVTTTPDIRILHDPWFSDGIYDGSWYQFPKVKNPLETIGDVNMIFISHIHPDHYDPKFIKHYFSHYGVKQVIIANHDQNYLAKKMQADGILPTIITNKIQICNTSVEIIPHRTGSINDIDSILVLKFNDDKKVHCVVNANDAVFDEELIYKLNNASSVIDVLMCGYTGAGSYPQTYYDITDDSIAIKADLKKQQFFERYKFLINNVNSKVNIPFAGKYILGGRLSKLNKFRGVADAVEVLEFDRKAVVLSDNDGKIDTSEMIATNIRTKPYCIEEIEQRLIEIKDEKMIYEKYFEGIQEDMLPLKRLLASAASNAKKKSECNFDYYFLIHLPNDQAALINANKDSESNLKFIDSSSIMPEPRSEIKIDYRYLFGLLVTVFHWNNAEVGSQYQTRRIPDVFNRKAQSFLNYLTV